MFRKPRERFSQVFRTHEGHKFYGEFGDPNAAPRPRREIQNLPHRTVVCSRRAVAKAGDLVSWRRAQFLLADQHTLANVNRFLGVEVTQTVRWTRFDEVIDPVARVAREAVEQELDAALPVALEPTHGIQEEGFDQTIFRMFTHRDVREGDRIEGMKVLRAYDLLGLRVAEMA